LKIGDWTIGSEGVEVPVFGIKDGDNLILPPAKQIWDFTLRRINCLMDVHLLDTLPKGSEGLIRSTLVTQSIAMLVNGMEVYAKVHFEEMERSGKQPDKEALLEAFTFKDKRTQVEKELSKGKNITKVLNDQDLIKFHNWKCLRRAYLAGYRIDVGTLPYQHDDMVDRISKYIHWRHRITHAVTEAVMLNLDDFLSKRATPIFATMEIFETIRSYVIDLIETIDTNTK
jgi:hypothetical protein